MASTLSYSPRALRALIRPPSTKKWARPLGACRRHQHGVHGPSSVSGRHQGSPVSYHGVYAPDTITTAGPMTLPGMRQASTASPVRSMMAAVLHQANKPLKFESVPVPKPAGREMLVRVKAASLCHSDLGFIQLGPITGEPLILGHEGIGMIEELGPEAAGYGFEIGDLVGAPCQHNMCLECLSCKSAGPDFCPTRQIKGLTSPGYFAEYTCVDAAAAVVIASKGTDVRVPARNLSSLFCAGVTVWSALQNANMQMGETIAVIGAGGLGQTAVQFASRMGAKVFALDIREEQLRSVRKDGAHVTINTKDMSAPDLVETILEKNNGKMIDSVIVTGGPTAVYNTAFDIVKIRGKVIAVSLGDGNLSFSVPTIASRNISLIGCTLTGQVGAKQCLDFTMRNQITPLANPRSFQLTDLNDMVDLMKAGRVEEGRMIVDFF